jgi:hypothetical protein
MRVPGFGPRRPVVETVDDTVVVERRPGEPVESFEARRATVAHDRASTEAAARLRREAYAEGRRDQHQIDRHAARSSAGAVMLSTLVVLVAAAGALWMVLAVQHGSFAGGGAVVDRTLARISQPARVAASDAADRTGVAVQSAGQALETQGERLRGTAQ